jgi:Tfp pilus assembly protein PilV
MQILDAIGVLIIIVGVVAIAVLLTSAYRERIASQHRAYEKEMAEDRNLYAALARRRRLKRGSSPEDEDKSVR